MDASRKAEIVLNLIYQWRVFGNEDFKDDMYVAIALENILKDFRGTLPEKKGAAFYLSQKDNPRYFEPQAGRTFDSKFAKLKNPEAAA